eukprot:COSAG06_NODE_39075_length_416_cov_1.943218_2_plen_24_part_01
MIGCSRLVLVVLLVLLVRAGAAAV